MGDVAKRNDEDHIGEPTNEVGIRALKQNASAVIARVTNGEELIVTDRGRPVAQIIPINSTSLERKFMNGQIRPPKRDKKYFQRPSPGNPVTPVLIKMREEERY